jgi:putative ABC transport system substrate-binding protein
VKPASAWRRIALGALLVVAFVSPALAAGARVIVVAEMEKAPQAEAVAALNDELLRDGVGVDVLAPASASHATLADASLIVTVGGHAARATVALKSASPVLHVLLSRSTVNALSHSPGGAPWSAVVLDQPAERQIALIRLALPEHERIATIAGPETAAEARALTAAAARSGLDVRSAEAADIPALYPALRSVLEQPAVLVVTPDGQVFNSHTVHHVLLTAFRLHAPVLGFSAAYVRAGAVLGLYTTPAQAGTETASVVRRVLAGQALPPPTHHALFEVGVNPTVARALGIQLPTADALTSALRVQEGVTP